MQEPVLNFEVIPGWVQWVVLYGIVQSAVVVLWLIFRDMTSRRQD